MAFFDIEKQMSVLTLVSLIVSIISYEQILKTNRYIIYFKYMGYSQFIVMPSYINF